MVRVLQISDTHLSPGKPHFAENWAPLLAWVRAQSPDLVVHTGDVTVDGADVEEDMRYCASLLPQLGARVLCIPGNHDVGEAGKSVSAGEWGTHRTVAPPFRPGLLGA